MKCFSKVLALVLLALFVGSSSAMAVQITGGQLQDHFNDRNWNINAQDDQMAMPGGWTLTTASGASNMVFYVEDPDGLEFGIYSTAGLEEATVFDNSDTPVAKATVSFEQGDALVVQYWDNNGVHLKDEWFNFTGKTFGFWISDTNTNKKYYSDKNRNDVDEDGNLGEEEDVALLVFKADEGSYVFAGDTDGNKDFANLVAQAESIKPVPEPATMLLFGLGLIGIAGVGKKRLFS